MKTILILFLAVILFTSCKKEQLTIGSKSEIEVKAGETTDFSIMYVKHVDFTLVGHYQKGETRTWKLKNENYVLIVNNVPQTEFNKYKVGEYVPSDLLFMILGVAWRG